MREKRKFDFMLRKVGSLFDFLKCINEGNIENNIILGLLILQKLHFVGYKE